MSIRPGTLLAASVLVLGSGACSISNPSPPPERETPQPPTFTPTPRRPTPTAPLPTATPSAASTVPIRELSSDGPWIVFPDDEGIWGLNEDGTGLTLLSTDEPDRVVPAPTGGLLAYQADNALDPRDWILHIYSIPQRQEVASIPLAPAYVEPDPDDPEAYRGWSARDAVSWSTPGLAWSPDGTRLAFVGIIDGESADLYSYSIETGRVVRLSSGPSQAYKPTWSPDGKYIVHFGVDSFCCGAGYSMEKAWASLADGTNMVALEDVRLVSDIFRLGWHETDPKLYVYAWSAYCEARALQEVNVATGEVTHLWPEWLMDVGLDRRGERLIFIGAKECGDEPTTMMISPTHEVLTIPLAGVTAVEWLKETRPGHPTYAVASTEQGQFLMPGHPTYAVPSTEQGQFLITTDGEALPIEAPPAEVGLPSQVSGTDMLLWAGVDGLWIGSLTDTAAAPAQILDGQVYDVFPSADSDHLVIFAGDGLWVASQADEFRPAFIGEGESMYAVRVEP